MYCLCLSQVSTPLPVRYSCVRFLITSKNKRLRFCKAVSRWEGPLVTVDIISKFLWEGSIGITCDMDEEYQLKPWEDCCVLQSLAPGVDNRI